MKSVALILAPLQLQRIHDEELKCWWSCWWILRYLLHLVMWKRKWEMPERRLCACVWVSEWVSVWEVEDECMWHLLVWEEQDVLDSFSRSEAATVVSCCCRSDTSTPPLLLCSSQVSLRHKSKKKTRGGECVSLCAVGCHLDPVWVCEKWQVNWEAVPLPGLHFSGSVLLSQLTEAFDLFWPKCLQEQVGVELWNHPLWSLRGSVQPYF